MREFSNFFFLHTITYMLDKKLLRNSPRKKRDFWGDLPHQIRPQVKSNGVELFYLEVGAKLQRTKCS